MLVDFRRNGGKWSGREVKRKIRMRNGKEQGRMILGKDLCWKSRMRSRRMENDKEAKKRFKWMWKLRKEKVMGKQELTRIDNPTH